MTDDRRLLEWAAKADGHGVEFDDVSGLTFLDSKAVGVLWNPLHNDGDALRLAVSLGLVIDCSRPSAGKPYQQHHVWLDELADNATLTRRAIVRAAAEIGRAMP